MAKETLENFNHVDLLFPSKYVKASDLGGKPATVVIESIEPRAELQMAGGKKQKKPVIHLKGKSKSWVLNKTNALIIAKVYGPELSKWIGKAIVIKEALVQFGGDEVAAIRVDLKASQAVAGPSAVHAGGRVADEPDHDEETGEVTDDYGPPPLTDAELAAMGQS